MPAPVGNSSWSPSDAELVLRARAGDAASLGRLLERHRSRLFASAIRFLGYRPEAEDAVQETCLIAMQHLGAIRDPEAVGAWLQAVLRRSCLHQRRRHHRELLTDAVPETPDERMTPEERIEQLELRDWIHGALQTLPEALRTTALLRYFGSYDSYEEVAAILGVPIGTVRSRLAEAKLKLADSLLAKAGLLDGETRSKEEQRVRFWTEAVREVFRRWQSDAFVSNFKRDCLVGWSSGKRAVGRHHIATDIDTTIDSGVRLEPARVLTSDGVAFVEGRFVNPPEDPEHCPPGIAFVVYGSDDENASGIRIHLAARPPRSSED